MTPLLLSLGLFTTAQPPGVPREIPIPLPLPAPGRPVPVPLPAPQPAPQPVPVALTLAEFSRTFTPLPGKHEVWFIHPSTKQPVRVCFVLPEGRLKRFEVDDRWIDFHFDKCKVTIDFRRNGRVEVGN
jgi:hypothetical protein